MAGRRRFVFGFFVVIYCQTFIESGLYTVDISEGLGRRFDGIGGLNGGGVSVYKQWAISREM